MPGKTFHVYILASRTRVLYVGVTSDLVRRAYEHREGLVEGFTRQYGLKQLVYYESFETRDAAFRRERGGGGASGSWS